MSKRGSIPRVDQARIRAWACVGAALLLSLGLKPNQALADDAGAVKSVFRAGAFASNITPPLGLPIVGNFNQPKATHVHDELHARCLVLDDGTRKLAFAICDSVGIPREVFDEAKKRAHEATGIPVEYMLTAATHSHSATAAGGHKPSASGEMEWTAYQKLLIRRIADGIRQANENLAPAQIGWGSADVPTQVFNRRWHMKEGTRLPKPYGGVDKVKMNPSRGSASLVKPAGPTDPQVSFLSLRTTSGQPIAFLGNYSLHYVGGVSEGHISADYFAVFADRMQQHLKADRLEPPFVGIMSNGTSGDVNNINFKVPSPAKKPYEKMREVADEVADAVFKANQSIKFHDWVPLDAAQRELKLATRKPTPEQHKRALEVVALPESAKLELPHERAYAQRLVALHNGPDEVSVILQSFRIGDLGIAAIPFEVFTESGLAIKEKSPFQPSFTIELANGSNGYLPTPRQHELGGYETWMGTNRVEVQASEKIVATLLDLFKDLKSRSTSAH